MKYQFEVQVAIYNMEGLLVKQLTLPAVDKKQVDVSDMPIGIYVLTLSNEQSSFFRKRKVIVRK